MLTKQLLSISGAILLSGALVATALFFRPNPPTSNPPPENLAAEAAQPGGNAPDPVPVPAPPTEAIASIDDDAILGNRATAQIGIIEFGDYECPFSKRFHDQALESIRRDYVDTGQAIFVYRDFPLHDPASTREARAANCAREQGGDNQFYEYHDQLYTNVPSSKEGLSLETLKQLAENIGLDGGQLETCLNSDKFGDEVAQDEAAASELGINGTPTLIIGQLSLDGTVEGTVVVGAQSYTTFQEAIEEQLRMVD